VFVGGGGGGERLSQEGGLDGGDGLAQDGSVRGGAVKGGHRIYTGCETGCETGEDAERRGRKRQGPGWRGRGRSEWERMGKRGMRLLCGLTVWPV